MNTSAASASVPTDKTPPVLASRRAPLSPACTPNPAWAAVTGPCGLALALVPEAPGNAAPTPVFRMSGIRGSLLRLGQAADQGPGRDDLAHQCVQGHRRGDDGTPREPADLNLGPGVGA